MTDWVFTARERFLPDAAESWKGYVEFSGFTHIEELVSLDSMLCPDLINDVNDDDWDFNVQQDFRITWFRDFDYLWQRVDWQSADRQVLSLFESPIRQMPPPRDFTPCGFDIADDCTGNSTLTNCGPLPSVVHRH